MSIKKTLLLFVLQLFSFQCALAGTVLIVEKTDGTTETFVLWDKPELTFEAQNVVITYKNNRVTIPRADIEEFHFDDDGTGIESHRTGNDVLVRFSGDDTVVISGMKNKHIVVSNIGGKLVNATITRSGEETTVSLNSLPQGIYIIKYDNNSIKVVRQ